ncbi:MAG: hypothetical protein KBH93_00335 [Anaerolineae bacterium]|nr:hypothetical protein [Anaerolineae bacterium]
MSESTARNWRRCKHSQLAIGTAESIIAECRQLSPEHVPALEFIVRLSRGTQEIRLAAEVLVDELTQQVLGQDSTWHIYSGPLKMAFNSRSDQHVQLELLSQASMVIDRILEMGIDQTDIPCVSELIRYSMHGWYLKGFLRTREASLASKLAGLGEGYLDTIERALYIGDGCATPSLISGHPERAMAYTLEALALLETADPSEERKSFLKIKDAEIMIRSIQANIACHWDFKCHQELVSRFVREYGKSSASNQWVEGVRQEVLGIVELARRVDFLKAANHFEQAGFFLDGWLAQFGIPFSTTSPQSLVGYALLMAEGPTPGAKLQISEGLLRTIDLGDVDHQIRARLCQALFYECEGNTSMAEFHREKAEDLSHQHHLLRWYEMLNGILLPPG